MNLIEMPTSVRQFGENYSGNAAAHRGHKIGRPTGRRAYGAAARIELPHRCFIGMHATQYP